MSATLSTYTLQWDSYSCWAPNDDTETGGIYTQKIKIYAVGDYTFEVEFRVGEGRTLGILFCKVTAIDNYNNVSELNYSFGEFMTNRAQSCSRSLHLTASLSLKNGMFARHFRR